MGNLFFEWSHNNEQFRVQQLGEVVKNMSTFVFTLVRTGETICLSMGYVENQQQLEYKLYYLGCGFVDAMTCFEQAGREYTDTGLLGN